MASSWRSFKLGERAPLVGACYVIFGDGKLLYVGSSKNLSVRLNQHKFTSFIQRKDRKWLSVWGEFKSIVVKYRPSKKFGDWAMVELRLIKRLKPFGNRFRGQARTEFAMIHAEDVIKRSKLKKPSVQGLTFSSGYRLRA